MTKDLVCAGPQFLLHPSAAHKAGCPLCNPTKTVPELNAAAGAALTSKQQIFRAVERLEVRLQHDGPHTRDKAIAGLNYGGDAIILHAEKLTVAEAILLRDWLNKVLPVETTPSQNDG